jgi:tRNA threonylcarbamoyladenosine biosynthesis protein TsaE
MIGKSAPGGTVICFRGGLGAGKTTLAKGVARGLGVPDEVTSPTYTIVSEYEGRLRLHHIDAYRLNGPEDFASVGGDELVADTGAICLIEWSEGLESVLPPGAAILEIEVEEDGSRIVRLEAPLLEGAIA